jgi:hypothetical protein
MPSPGLWDTARDPTSTDLVFTAQKIDQTLIYHHVAPRSNLWHALPVQQHAENDSSITLPYPSMNEDTSFWLSFCYGPPPMAILTHSLAMLREIATSTSDQGHQMGAMLNPFSYIWYALRHGTECPEVIALAYATSMRRSSCCTLYFCSVAVVRSSYGNHASE